MQFRLSAGPCRTVKSTLTFPDLTQRLNNETSLSDSLRIMPA
jgi:hypothetical protein